MSQDPIDRLPAWARNEIVKLRSDVDHLRRQLLGLEVPNSRVVADPWSDLTRRSLGVRPIIRFYVETDAPSAMERPFIDVQLDQHLRELEIRGDDHLLIEPRSSNAISVYRGRA